jgi:hypothetical protein
MTGLTFLKSQAEQYLTLVPESSAGITRGLVFMISVRSEDDGKRLVGRLERAGYSNLRLEQLRIFLRKKWRVSGLSHPVTYAVPDIHRWLDSVDELAREYDGTLETWAPSE